jgi:hypothetical protein
VKHHLATAGLLVAAILFYMVGWSGGGISCLAAGVTLEVWFWIRVGRRSARQRGA